jgi:uncharacterized membrane protein
VTQPSGEVRFKSIDTDSTRVQVHIEYEPQGAREAVRSALGLDDRQIKKDLERFKEIVESRGIET